MFRMSRLLSVSSGLVAITCSTVGRMFQDRLALLQIRLDVADEFLGFRLETGGHVAHVSRRDVCGCVRFFVLRDNNARQRDILYFRSFRKRAKEERRLEKNDQRQNEIFFGYENEYEF